MLRFFQQFTLILVLAFTFVACSSENDLENIVMDEAAILDKDSALMEQYREYNAYLLEKFDIDFRVITTYSTDDINIFTNKRFQALESRSVQGRMILLVINVTQDKTRVEVSTSLEHIFTDSFVSYIERKGMVPYFRDNRVADGVYMMSELIKDTAMDASLGEGTQKEAKSTSIGAGAKTEAKIGQVDETAKQGVNITSSEGDTPADVLAKYFDTLRTHNKNPNLDIFTKETQKFFASWTVTDVNQNNELRFTKECTKGKYYFTQTHAALIQPLKPRTCAPYLFKVEDGKWKLDIYTMAKVLRFNTQMMWHFDMSTKEQYLAPYEPFFQNLRYDENGFPFYKQRKKLKWGFTCTPWYKPGEKEKLRCWISWLDEKGKAKNLLSLQVGDRIMSLGTGASVLDDPSLDNVMEYMKGTQEGQTVRLGVIRNEKDLDLKARLE